MHWAIWTFNVVSIVLHVCVYLILFIFHFSIFHHLSLFHRYVHAHVFSLKHMVIIFELTRGCLKTLYMRVMEDARNA